MEIDASMSASDELRTLIKTFLSEGSDRSREMVVRVLGFSLWGADEGEHVALQAALNQRGDTEGHRLLSDLLHLVGSHEIARRKSEPDPRTKPVREQICFHLLANPKSRPSELAQQLNLRRSQVSRALSELVQVNQVARIPDPADARSWRYSIATTKSEAHRSIVDTIKMHQFLLVPEFSMMAEVCMPADDEKSDTFDSLVSSAASCPS
jgi:DNA-binding MarR family transcriptional regulator